MNYPDFELHAPTPQQSSGGVVQSMIDVYHTAQSWRDDLNAAVPSIYIVYWAMVVCGAALMLSSLATKKRARPARFTDGRQGVRQHKSE
jgi:hypothetical protein